MCRCAPTRSLGSDVVPLLLLVLALELLLQVLLHPIPVDAVEAISDDLDHVAWDLDGLQLHALLLNLHCGREAALIAHGGVVEAVLLLDDALEHVASLGVHKQVHLEVLKG